MCAKQIGEKCTEVDICDTHRGLYCDYSRDAPRYEIGVCAQMVGVGCLLNGIRYNNGESFQPNCKYNCSCINGAVGCIPLCTDSKPPLVWCPNPKQIKVKGECCEEWVCDYSKKARKTSPRHISSAVYGGEIETWEKNCILQTSAWSPCSKTCGMGISTRISNDNAQCRKVSYRPKYCGLCLDDRCCSPYKSKTIEVNFRCPEGTDFSRKIMWINACFCNLSCKNPNDIFADLAHYHDYSEIAD
ncbi:hypothetical protein E2320_011703 [Naja naja]|nr:hypothetical protein E2320_011703 [Naja naja]